MQQHQLTLSHNLDLPVYLAPSAWVEHIPFSFELIEKTRPKVIVELGVHYGVSYFSFCQAIAACNLSSACYAIDNWKGDEHAGFYGEDIFEKVRAHNEKHYSGFSYLLRSTFEDALTYFNDKSIDLLHIDGFHTYEAVKKDFQSWLPKLSDSSIVLFHDISVKERDFGVFRLWDELSAIYPSFSFIHGYGLGVLATGKNIPGEILPLFQMTSEEASVTRTFYRRLGITFTERTRATEANQKIEVLLANLEAARAEQLSSEEKLKDKESQSQALAAASEIQARELENLRQELGNRSGQVHELSERVESLEANLREMTGQLGQKEVQLTDLSGQLSQGETQLADLIGKLNQGEIQLADLNGKLRQGEMQLADLSGQLSRQNEQVALLSLQLETLSAEIEQLSAENLQLHESVLNHSGNEATLQAEAGIMKNRGLEMEDEIRLLKLKNESLDGALSSQKTMRQAEQEAFLAKISGLNDRLAKEIAESSILQEKLRSAEEALRNEQREQESNNSREIASPQQAFLPKIIKPLRTNNMSNLLSTPRKLAKGIKWFLNGSFRKNYARYQERIKFPHVPDYLMDDYLLLSNSQLFDAQWYLAQYPDVSANGHDPISHYLQYGYKEARDPSVDFSTSKYLQTYADVKANEHNPLVHFLRHGKEEGRQFEPSGPQARPSQTKPDLSKEATSSFNPSTRYSNLLHNIPPGRAYKKNSVEYKLIEESGLFDEKWYRDEYNDAINGHGDLLEHYLNIGFREGRNPNPLFDTFWYLTKYDRVRRNGENPLVHYVQNGAIDPLGTHPLFQVESYNRSNPDIAAGRVNPLIHYLKYGYKEKRIVHLLFNEAFYLRQANLPDGTTNAIHHYLATGWKHGLNPNPFFDVNYYIRHNLGGIQTEPLSHFVEAGIEQKVNPSEYFDLEYYKQITGLSGQSPANTLIHFLTHGIDELRRPSSNFKIFEFHREGGMNAIPNSLELDKYLSKEALDPAYEYQETKARIENREAKRLRSLSIKRGDLYELKESELDSFVSQIAFRKNEHPKVSVIIPYYNARRYMIEALLSLSKKTSSDLLEVIVIDDNSPENTGALIKRIPNLVYHKNDANEGFIRTCNQGGAIAKGEYLFFFNCDAQITPNAIENLVKAMESNPSIGVAGPKVLYPSGHLQEAGCRIFPDGTSGFVGLNDDPNAERYMYSREVDYVSGCSLLIRKELFQKAEGFSIELAPAYCEDADLCMKVRALGYKIWYQHDAVIYHHLSAATDSAYKNYYIARNQGIFLKKWFHQIQELNDVKILPFYFPQFHPYKENEFWWGKGFTEWTNTAKTLPNYEGHAQPKLPTDQGFYDIRLPEAMEHQKLLAEKYGVFGFCFYYYWFAGKRIMELPIDRILSEGRPDMPFSICWANENFTRRWDGGNNEIMLGQDHTDEDDEAVIKDILRYAQHKNYIRVNGKPLILLYRFSLFPDIKRTTATWRRIAKETGVGELLLGFVESFQHAYQMDDPKDYGFDFSTQFPPHQNSAIMPVPGKLLNPDFTGNVHDYREMVLNYTSKKVPGFRRFPGCMPGWDNTPRQKNKPNIFAFTSPGSFQAWLEWNIKITAEQNAPGERFVFINAWNEWAEGAFLEPDREHGHGYLEAIRHGKQSWLK